MEIALPAQNSRTLMIATLGVFVLGLALSFSTWRNLRQQQDSFREHALVTARAIASGIEINLRRELRLPGTGATDTICLPQRPVAKNILQEYITRTDARFIGFYNPRGHILFSSHSDPKSIHLQLPGIAWESMGTAGEWSGELHFEGQPILVLGKLSALVMDTGNADDSHPSGTAQPPLLLVGVDMTQHLAAFGKYRRTAILQTGYILAVTLVFWILLMAVLQRTEQDRRLRSLETFNARLLDSMPDGLLTLAADGAVTAANPAAQHLLGGASLIGKPHGQLFSGMGLDPSALSSQEWTTCNAKGKHLEILKLPLRDESGQSLLLLRDRTELVALETKLHRHEKLAAIGRMAAGVAHEIRNPLSALRGFAQFFSKKLAGREPEELYAQTMVREADRLNRVITDLLFLARPRELRPERLVVSDMFTETIALLTMDATAAHCRFAQHTETETVLADRDALKQALINLGMNSMAALPETGGQILLASQSGEGGIWIRVTDNGKGMNDEEQEHALEPFFTTRERGTGLGLAIVHTIMQEHGGQISLSSTTGQGTAIALFFPDHPADAKEDRA